MDDLLQCPICFVAYNFEENIPKQLDCQHILCSQCLPFMTKQNDSKTSFIECPLCKNETHKYIEDVPRSLIILQIIEATKPKSTKSKQANAPPIPPRPINKYPPLPPLPPLPQLPILAQTQPPIRPTTPPPEYNKVAYNHSEWDTKSFLLKIFNEMDINRDGSITTNELQEALKRGQGSEFSLKTVDLLVSKYDKNGDREISFDEFHDLYINLNCEYENFLLTDSDGSGTIDTYEFSETMSKKGYLFSSKFFKFIIDEISKHTGLNGIKFDNFIRCEARFDYLIEYYNKTPFFQKYPLETYLKNTFFQDFW